MIDVVDERVYLDGYLVASIRSDIPPTIRDRLENALRYGAEDLWYCEECGNACVEHQ